MTTRDMSGRVAIQHAVNRLVDDLEAEYGLLSDAERLARLVSTADDATYGGLALGFEPNVTGLVRLMAEAQLLTEAIQTRARR